MRVISFSVWGSNVGFLVGAISNIKLARLYYPNWKCRIYCGTDVPMRWREELAEAGFEVHVRSATVGLHDGMFWRFEPAFDPKVELFISRDLDSRVNPREAAAVAEWLASGKRLHTMRDHYEHIVPILGGMWGCRHWPEFAKLMSDWHHTGKMGDDQDFLKQKIWPLVRDNDSVAHDLYTQDTTVSTPNGPFTYKPVEFYGKHDLRPFPSHSPMDEKTLGKHVGARVWE
jgi:hypothetical protein